MKRNTPYDPLATLPSIEVVEAQLARTEHELRDLKLLRAALVTIAEARQEQSVALEKKGVTDAV